MLLKTHVCKNVSTEASKRGSLALYNSSLALYIPSLARYISSLALYNSRLAAYNAGLTLILKMTMDEAAS